MYSWNKTYFNISSSSQSVILIGLRHGTAASNLAPLISARFWSDKFWLKMPPLITYFSSRQRESQALNTTYTYVLYLICINVLMCCVAYTVCAAFYRQCTNAKILFFLRQKPCCCMETARWRCKFSSIRRVPRAYVGECRHIGFHRTGNSAIRSTDPTPKTLNMEWIVDRITRCWDMAITYHEGAFILREGEVVGDHWS